jgi:hypothetical protein
MNAQLQSWDANGAPLEQVLIPSREQILTLETRMREFEQIDCPLTHTFAPGSYARGICLPATALVVGKIHLHAHLNIVSKGLVTVVTEFGRMQIDAREHPVTFTSQPGTKRALYVHEETWWTTVHLTDSTDLAEIEREIIAPTYSELDAAMASACIELIEGAENASE